MEKHACECACVYELIPEMIDILVVLSLGYSLRKVDRRNSAAVSRFCVDHLSVLFMLAVVWTW